MLSEMRKEKQEEVLRKYLKEQTGFLFVWLVGLVFFFSFIFISWRLITLQYCSGFCHTLT